MDGREAAVRDPALEVLVAEWGFAFEIGCGAIVEYWAVRRDGIGEKLAGGDAQELYGKMADSYAMKAVVLAPPQRAAGDFLEIGRGVVYARRADGSGGRLVAVAAP